LHPVEPSETLSHYIYSRSQFSKTKVKYSAFMPPGNKELSVFRIDGLNETQIWDIGDKIRDKPSKARADITGEQVSSTGLKCDPNDDPPGHVNIIGWPDDESAIKLNAIELAEQALLKVK